MGLRSVFSAALPGIFSAAGEPAVFTPASGAPVDCYVFIDFTGRNDPLGMEPGVFRQAILIDGLISEFGRRPVKDETITVYPTVADRTAGTNGTVYTVQAPIDDDGLSFKMEVTAP